MLFCGGDGTARDICALTGETTPVLGIPAGVKMYSGVFGVTPARTAEILWRWLSDEIGLARVDIVDLDEDKYRRDEWAVRLYLAASAPFEPTLVQSAKALVAGRDEDAVKDDIAAQLRDEIAARPGTLFLLGPGSTVQAVAPRAAGRQDAARHRRGRGRQAGRRRPGRARRSSRCSTAIPSAGWC